ncbi:MAG: hypothetical protein ACRDPM_26325, partial [Solirubrobacteraceae bacterium]
MLQACESGQGAAVTGLFGGLNLTTCYEVAGVYYAAVHDTDTGQDAFNSGTPGGSAHTSGSAQGSYAQAAGTMIDPTGSGTLVWT